MEDSNRISNELIKQLEKGLFPKVHPQNNENICMIQPTEENESNLIPTLLKSTDGEKFWEIRQNKEQLNIRFGKMGSNGQILIKTFLNDMEAQFAKDKLIEEQKSCGFDDE